MMDIESEEDANNEELDIEPLTLKTDKKLKLSREAESTASSIISKRNRFPELNRALDPANTAQKNVFVLKTRDFGVFEHFMTKNKHREERADVLEALR
jgi:hypothetical protein